MSEPKSRSTGEDPKPSSPSIQVRGNRTLTAGGDVNSPTFLGDIIDSVVNVYGSMSPIMRFVSVATLFTTIITLVFVIRLMVLANGSELPKGAPPDASRLVVVPGAEDLAVTAMHVERTDEPVLWFGAVDQGQPALYRLDPALGRDATPERVLNVDEHILDIVVDCHQNVWLALSELGTLVYRPATGQRDTFLNISTTNGWLSKNTAFAVETRCRADGTVDVWLGRKGVHTLRYAGEYPDFDTITFLPWDEDDLFLASESMNDVSDLLYVGSTETLWAASWNRKLLPFSFRGVLKPVPLELDDALWSLGSGGDQKTVWVGGGSMLWNDADRTPIQFYNSDQIQLNNQAKTIAVDGTWVWFGDKNCAVSTATCWPLGVYSQGELFSVPIGERRQVNALAVDPFHGVWIGTERGIIHYPGKSE